MCCDKHCSHEALCITSVPVFKGMNEANLQQLQKVTRSRSFDKGEFIFREGERSETLFVVNGGLIKLTKMSPEGKEQIVRLLFPGDFFGLFSLLKMEHNADLSYRFLLSVNDRLYEADESVGFLSLMEVEQRLARALILFHDKMNAKNGSFTLPITKKDLASYIGTTPESVSRKLLSFMSKKLISMDGRRQIQILELDQLKKISGIN
jgi:CRP-like cAMP-binding protein